jgi:Na+-driven multidrug efflux pump
MKEKFTYAMDLIKLAVPSFGSMLVGSSMFTVDLYFISLSKNVNMINGVGLGTMIMNLFGLQTFIGLNGAIETLVP